MVDPYEVGGGGRRIFHMATPLSYHTTKYGIDTFQHIALHKIKVCSERNIGRQEHRRIRKKFIGGGGWDFNGI